MNRTRRTASASSAPRSTAWPTRSSTRSRPSACATSTSTVPNQRFDAYGNVIPIFVFRMLRGEPLTIFGDGEQTRDFVNVHDVVQANLKAADPTVCRERSTSAAAFANHDQPTGRAAECGDWASGHGPPCGPPRAGDVRHSLADIGAARRVPSRTDQGRTWSRG